MKSFFFAFLFLFSLKSFANEVYDIDLGDENEEAMILLTNGKVIFTNDKESLNSLVPQKSYAKSRPSFVPQMSIEPTLIEGMEGAKKLFKAARTDRKPSECFNRAHVWSYEWFRDSGIFSEKVWIFFSRKYIRKYKFEWWFHVAPLIHVKEGEQVLERVMDIKYLPEPQNISRWSDVFMRNKSTCLNVQKYSDYANYSESAWCHIMKTDMFSYQPVDIESEEYFGYKKTNWIEDELKEAYKNALNEKF